MLTWDQPNCKWDNGDVERYTVEWRTVANDEAQDRQIYFQQVGTSINAQCVINSNIICYETDAITDHVHLRAFQTLYCICTCNNANALMQIHSDTGRHVQVCGLTKGLEHKFRVAAVN